MPDDGRLFSPASAATIPAPPAPPPAAPRRPRLPPAGQLLRIALGLGLIGTAAYFLHDRFVVAEARQAVLDGAPVTLRSPIEGVLDSLSPVAPGMLLGAGTVLGQVRNPRLDDARLNDLARFRHEAEAEAALAARRLVQVRTELAEARRGAAAFTAARVEILAARLQEADSALAAARARQAEAVAGLRRAESLATTGTLAGAGLDAARRAAEVAAAETRAAADRRESMAVEHRAALSGVFASDTANDRSLSQVALERLRLQESELEAQRKSALSRAGLLAAQIAEEMARFERLRSARLESPTEARLVRRLAQPGEHVGPGQGLLLLADCSQPEAVAQLERRVFRDLRQGQQARFHPAGGGAPRDGTITALRAEAPNADGAGGRLEVVVAMEAAPGATGCESGRLGRLTFH